MKIVATTNPVTVAYRIPGKFYNQGAMPEGRPPENTAERSDFAFDSVELAVGQEFDTAGSELIYVKDLTPSEGPVETPVAP